MFKFTLPSTKGLPQAFQREFKNKILPGFVERINKRVGKAHETVKNQMRRKFDAPTDFVLNTSIKILYMTVNTRRLEIRYVNPYHYGVDAEWFLRPQEVGGTRPLKPIERAAFHNTRVYILPGKDAQLDSKGNLSRNIALQYLAGIRKTVQLSLNARGQQKASVKSQTRGLARNFFVILPKGLRLGSAGRRVQSAASLKGIRGPGLYERVGWRVYERLMFSSKTAYRKRITPSATFEKALSSISQPF